MDDAADIRESDLERLIPLFYARVRADPDLGPVFDRAVDDWPEHLARLTDFWSSVMLGTGRFKGHPMAAHIKHRDHITPAQFDRWLALWAETTAEVMPPAAATALQERADRIARSLQLGLFFKLEPHPRSVRTPV